MTYKRNDLIDSLLNRYYCTFELTLDTEEYVPPNFDKKIKKYIFKCFKKDFKKINGEYKEFCRNDKIENYANKLKEKYLRKIRKKEDLKKFANDKKNKSSAELIQEDNKLKEKIKKEKIKEENKKQNLENKENKQ